MVDRVGAPIGDVWWKYELTLRLHLDRLTALRIGAKKWNVATCLHKLKDLIKTVFKEKPFAKTWGLGWIFRCFYESIFDTNTLQNPLKSIFSSKPFVGISGNNSATVGSLINHTRIAITTTDDNNCRLFTNYQVDDKETNMYLDANTKVLEV